MAAPKRLISRRPLSVFPPQKSRGLTIAVGLLASWVGFACQDKIVDREFVAGRPVALWNQGESFSPYPLLVTGPNSSWDCEIKAGPCAQVCTDAPASCPPEACRPVILDSLTPLSTAQSEKQAPHFGLHCAELRGSPKGQDLGATSTRLRVSNFGLLRLPRTGKAPNQWRYRAGQYAGAVLGGDFLRLFAAEFRFSRLQEPNLRFFQQLPGTQVDLARSGLAYLRVQAPGQLLGRELGDLCTLNPGLSCPAPQSWLGRSDTQSTIPPSLMALDACVSPLPCGLRHNSAQQSCELVVAREGPSVGCKQSSEADGSGRTASLLLATAAPGLTLFSDSAQRMFGPLDRLPRCDAAKAKGFERACLQSINGGELQLPGWELASQLPQIRVRSLALVSGITTTTGLSPCQRLESRKNGLLMQCNAYLRTRQPQVPAAEQNPDNRSWSLHDDFVQFGEIQWQDATQLSADPKRWIPALVLPAEHPAAISLRRSVGTIAAEPDGLLGLGLFGDSRVILDYTEQDDKPGLRVQCLEPETQSCWSAPLCSSGSNDDPRSCCFALPPALLLQDIEAQARAMAADPKIPSHPCCAALGQSARKALLQRAPGACPSEGGT